MPAAWPLKDHSRFVDAAGIRWHIQESGAGPVLLLIHGTGASTHSWRDLIPPLARTYRVIAIDLPGHGLTSAAGRGQSSIMGMSRALAALLRAVAVTPAFCVGHSAGAVVLCRMVLDGHLTPHVVVSLNGAFLPLSGAAARVLSPFARLLAGSSLVPRLLARHAGTRDSVARLVQGTGSRLDARGLDYYVQLVGNPKHLGGALQMMGNWDLNAFGKELPRLPVPLILIVGENDLIVPPAQAQTVQRAVASATVMRLPGLGHLAHEEQPALVARMIQEVCGAYRSDAPASGEPAGPEAQRAPE